MTTPTLTLNLNLPGRTETTEESIPEADTVKNVYFSDRIAATEEHMPSASGAKDLSSSDRTVATEECMPKSGEANANGSKSMLTDYESALEDVEKAHVDDARIEHEPFLVDFKGPDDPGNPKSWTTKRRWLITGFLGLTVFTVTFASSIFNVNLGVVEQKFGVDRITATLGVSLFILGFVFGPIAFGPISEVVGRKPPLFFGFALFAIFQIPVALAQNITTICISRFLSGFFASAPLAVIGGALADIWDPIPRSYAICVFAAGGFVGPVAGPIAGGFLTESSLGWRWTSWITLILAGVVGVCGFFVIPETSAARILQLRAAKLRKETDKSEYHSAFDENKLTANKVFNVYLLRPFVMFLQEPILALITAYMSVIYGITYLLLGAFSVSFYENRGWSLSVAQLPFAAFIVGIVMGGGIIAYSSLTNFTRAYVKNGRAMPEERLPPMIVGAIALPVGLFWFAWTSNPNVIWVPQVLSVALIGFGTMVPFWQGLSYIIDCYGFYSNSAIAVNTFLRSLAGAFFPLFTHAMYRNLGVDWATSLLAFICVAFIPVPVLFYMYGEKIRAKSKWAPSGPQ